jgi:hypothetical protein
MPFDDTMPPITLNRGEALVLITAANGMVRKLRRGMERGVYSPAPGQVNAAQAQLGSLSTAKDKLVSTIQETEPQDSASASPHAGPTVDADI